MYYKIIFHIHKNVISITPILLYIYRVAKKQVAQQLQLCSSLSVVSKTSNYLTHDAKKFKVTMEAVCFLSHELSFVRCIKFEYILKRNKSFVLPIKLFSLYSYIKTKLSRRLKIVNGTMKYLYFHPQKDYYNICRTTAY